MAAARKPQGARGRRPAGAKSAARGGTAKNAKPAKPAPRPKPAAAAAPPTGPFRLGVIPGATPGKWIDAWQERMPGSPLELVPIDVATQRAALDGVDAALVRLPIDADDLHVIALYDEIAVVVCGAESHLTAADELTAADLAGEVLLVPQDAVWALDVPGTVAAAFAAPATTEDAIETVAAGVGIVIVPMSLARLHQRKDAAHRPLRGGPTSTVALAWHADRTTPHVDAFVGIVRGRTANSSR